MVPQRERGGIVTSVTAVVVTYNRVTLLTECLDALLAQTCPVAHVVVVDNASTDSTPAVLAVRRDVETVRLGVNTGGAGGFAAGIDRALARGCDAVWLLDDDTIPQADALAELRAGPRGLPRARTISRGKPRRLDRRARPPDEHAPHVAERESCRHGRRRFGRGSTGAFGLLRVSSRRRVGRRGEGSAGRRLLSLERRLRVHDAPDPRTRRHLRPVERRRSQDEDVREHRRRPG